MREVQDRIVAYLARLRADYPGARIALVTHAEVMRTAILHCEGLSLDAYAQVLAPIQKQGKLNDDRCRFHQPRSLK